MVQGPFQIVVDRDRCMGNGICLLWFDDLFTIDDEGKAVGPGPLDASERERGFMAVQNCPARALTIVEA